MKKEKGMTLLEVSLALIVTTSVMVTVWFSIQDIIRFYLTRTVAYTVINKMNIAIDTCKKQSAQSAQSAQCVITDMGSSKGNFTIEIKDSSIIGCLTLDGKINEDILKHMTSFYYVKNSDAKDQYLSSLPIHPVEQPRYLCNGKQLAFYYRILK